MNTLTVRKFSALLILMILLAGCSGPVATEPADPQPVVSPSIADIVTKYREQIQEDMRLRHIPGLAIAVVALRGSGRSRSTRWYFLAVGLTLLAFNAVIII